MQAYQSLSQNNIVIVSAPFLLVLRETNKLSKIENMGIISDFKMFLYWHKMLAYLIALGYIVLIFVIFVLSLIIAQQNEDIDTLKYIDDNQCNTKIDEYPNKRKSEKEISLYSDLS